jgi:hypothetical protein
MAWTDGFSVRNFSAFCGEVGEASSGGRIEARKVTLPELDGYRSRGGGHGLVNRVTLCRFHHRRGEHGGLMSVRGEAPLGLIWRLGRADVAVGYCAERLMSGRGGAISSSG